MNFPSELVPTIWLWVGHGIYALLLLWALYRAPWHYLKNSGDINVFLAAIVGLWLIWRMSGGVTSGLEFHLLLVPTVTLMFGWQFATLAVSVAQLLLSIEGQADWYSFSLNVLVNGILGVWLTYWIFWLVYLWMPRNIFIYLYVCAFFGGALTMLCSRLIGVGFLWVSGTYDYYQIQEELPVVIIMLFPEAFLNGMLMTIFVVFRPQWVSSFNDEHFLRGGK